MLFDGKTVNVKLIRIIILISIQEQPMPHSLKVVVVHNKI